MSSLVVQGCFYAEEPCHLAGVESAGTGLLWHIHSFLFFLIFPFAWCFLLLMPTHGPSLPVKSIYQELQLINNTIWWKNFSLLKYTRIQLFFKPRNVVWGGALAASRYQQLLCEATHAARCTMCKTSALFAFKLNFQNFSTFLDWESEVFLPTLYDSPSNGWNVLISMEASSIMTDLLMAEMSSY